MIIERFGGNVRQTQRYLRQPSISTQNVGIQECCRDNNRDAAEPGLSRAENKAGFGQVTPVE